MKTKQSIFVTFQFEGFHCWPDSPEEVDFLKNRHRHIFHCDVEIEVFHDDRELEFILVKRFLEEKVREFKSELENKSCEMISDIIAGWIGSKYKPDNRHISWPQHDITRQVNIQVSEDGENGSRSEYII